MRIVLTVLMLLALAGCSTVPPHQKGGGAKVSVPPASTAEVTQPENPEGETTQSFEERTVIHHPDGRIDITDRKTAATIGGSQDLAKIIKQAGKADVLRGLVISFSMLVAAFMIRTEWPFAAIVLAAGGIGSLVFAWWVGPVSMLIAGALFVGYQTATAHGRKSLI